MKKGGSIVLIIDGGGRGSALVDGYDKSKYVKKILAVPGNDMMGFNTKKPVKIYPKLKTTSIDEILEICKKENVQLVDVAQDNAIESGLVDKLTALNIPVVGPTRAAGQIEWDKGWARDFGQRYGLPQPKFKVCHSLEEGENFLKIQKNKAWFVKASGLAEGKGALPANNNDEAVERIKELSRFGEAGKVFVLEEWLCNDDGSNGEEFSLFILSDGRHYQIAGTAQDHKRVNDFDEGENTGGMGVSTPPLLMRNSLLKQIKKEIIDKTITGLIEEKRPYKGVLYLGGIVVKKKGKLVPYVIEFNARWGDPEVEAILPGLKNDLYEVSMAIVQQRLNKVKLKPDSKARVVIAGASRGYPGNYSNVKGKQIFGLEKASRIVGVKIYGAGVKVIHKKYFANGGRLFYVVGEGKNVIEARMRAYHAISLINVEGNNLHFRTDIGWRDIERLNSLR